MASWSAEKVGALVAAMPQAAPVFEQFGIDYCCGGQRTLEEACVAAGIVERTVIDALEQAPVRPLTTDWRTAPIPQLIDHIVDRHHVYTREALARIDALLGKVCGVHGKDHPELLDLRSEVEMLRDDLGAHLVKEEQVLFPCVRALAAAGARRLMPTVAHPVWVMNHEHQAASQSFATIRRITDDFTPPPDACGSFFALFAALEELELDLHQHMHLESNVLFPRAIELERTGS